MGAALKFKHTNIPRQQGEQARLKVVQGPDFGAIYVLTSSHATLGRGDENDAVVSDLKASRRHAEISQGAGGWVFRDLGSANGILHNGKTVRSGSLKSGDTLTFGETTVEFITSESSTLMLVAPPKDPAQVHAELAAFAAQKQKIQALGSVSGGADSGSGPLKDKRVLLIGGLLVLGFILFGTDPPKKTPKSSANNSGESRDLASYLPQADPAFTNKTAEMFFKSGFREYRERNYIRARMQFETVLQMSPDHGLAKMYLDHCNKAIEDVVKFHLERGKKSLASGKLRDAKGQFESVTRLLYRDQMNPNYIEAKEQLAVVYKEIGRGGDGS